MIWVDASVWLELALNQEKAQTCEDFLNSAMNERIFTTDFDVYSMTLTLLKYKRKAHDVKTFLGVLSSFPHITIFRPSALIVAQAVDAMNTLKLTFDDSLTYTCMNHLGIKKIATLDSDYKKLPVEYVL